MIRVIAHAQKVEGTRVPQAAQVRLAPDPVWRSIDATVMHATLWFKRILMTLLLCSMPCVAPAIGVLGSSPVEVVAASVALAPELRLGHLGPSPEHALQWSEQRTDYEPEFLECAEDAEDDTPEPSSAWFVSSASATPSRAKTSSSGAYAAFTPQRFATSARPRGPPLA